MDHFPTHWGRPRNELDDQYNTFPLHQRPANHTDTFANGVQRTQQPIVTGTSVLAIQYKDGIMMAADNLASYGSLARFKDITRLHAVGTSTVIGASGDMSDFQHIQRVLDDIVTDEFTAGDGNSLGPAEIHEFLARRMYARRSKMNPLWNSLLVGGFQNGKRFLAFVDLLGTTYSAPSLATGYGAHIALPLLRQSIDPNPDAVTEEAAREILRNCMRVLYYRDARSLDKYQIATVTEAGVTISDTQKLDTTWDFAENIRGYGAQTQ
ncbi:proteasome endopeptidase complex beta subunit [Rhodofomes roseus]|uniref:Proteasome subunit beta n=1 Tax=Rhodofomes roseus TaxID=34475 RepID=A0A4Y9XNC1_9APHY|nr:proteasome endopeptidase complex beta subunit [Rhodofomes roseus]KAH9840705.1 proteasome endopeptidase complex beta subunit [Rhodofomes roseus]TFY51814.1 hypothetical protein EVJ58_g10366 [Rhodofomes roseus]